MRSIRWRRPDAGWRGSRSALVAYAAGWIVAAALVVAVVHALFGDDGDSVTVPPVRSTELSDAAGAAHCVLRRATGREQLDPPVDGPAGARPAKAGFYDDPLPPDALTGALRHGLIVIQFRPGLAGEITDQLRVVQSTVPAGTIVAPNATEMRFDVVVTAYRRLLGCPHLSARALDAVRLFRGRFLGSGAESP